MVKFAGLYNELTNTTPLPHKTIALLAGLWWIGKHNLLVTPEFGSAISLYTVLTDAPVKTVLHPPARSLFGDCSICWDICSPGALTGRASSAAHRKSWKTENRSTALRWVVSRCKVGSGTFSYILTERGKNRSYCSRSEMYRLHLRGSAWNDRG